MAKWYKYPFISVYKTQIYKILSITAEFKQLFLHSSTNLTACHGTTTETHNHTSKHFSHETIRQIHHQTWLSEVLTVIARVCHLKKVDLFLWFYAFATMWHTSFTLPLSFVLSYCISPVSWPLTCSQIAPPTLTGMVNSPAHWQNVY